MRSSYIEKDYNRFDNDLRFLYEKYEWSLNKGEGAVLDP